MRYLRFAFVFLFSLSLAVPAHVSAYEFEGIPILPKVFDPPYDRDLYKHWIDAAGWIGPDRPPLKLDAPIPGRFRTMNNPPLRFAGLNTFPD